MGRESELNDESLSITTMLLLVKLSNGKVYKAGLKKETYRGVKELIRAMEGGVIPLFDTPVDDIDINNPNYEP